MRQEDHNFRTVKIPLELSEDQRDLVLKTMESCKHFFNYAVKACCESKTHNYFKMAEKGKYAIYRGLFPELPSVLIGSVLKEACRAVKNWNYRHKKEQWKCSVAQTSYWYPLNKAGISRRNDLTSIASIGGRIRLLCSIPNWFVDRYKINTNSVYCGKIHLTKTGIYLCLTYYIWTKQSAGDQIIGVDRGLYNLCALSDGTIFSSKRAVAIKRKYQYLRSKLKQKGTRSAKRHLRAMCGREKRFMQDFDHCVTKQLASRTDVGIYVLEDLSGVREKPVNEKVRHWLNEWSYYRFEAQLRYKCAFEGIDVVFVKPQYTSQQCSACGNIDKNSRKKSRYRCKSCGHTENADVNAAKNIRDKYVRNKRNRVLPVTQS